MPFSYFKNLSLLFTVSPYLYHDFDQDETTINEQSNSCYQSLCEKHDVSFPLYSIIKNYSQAKKLTCNAKIFNFLYPISILLLPNKPTALNKLRKIRILFHEISYSLFKFDFKFMMRAFILSNIWKSQKLGYTIMEISRTGITLCPLVNH